MMKIHDRATKIHDKKLHTSLTIVLNHHESVWKGIKVLLN